MRVIFFEIAVSNLTMTLQLMNVQLDLRDRFLQVATSFRRFKSNQNKNISCSRQSQQQIHRRIINELK